jgi:molybdopterin molybdotransferase
MALDFWKIAMRPGKPLMFGRIGDLRVLGLPGNPVSSLVCAILFLRPLIDALLGRAPADVSEPATLGADIAANDRREDYVRARLTMTEAGAVATALPVQDSSMLAVLAEANCLLIRPANAPAAKAGERCRIIRLP